MNFIIFFVYVPLVHSASHTFMTTYSGLNGQAVAGIPEISAVTTLDGEQIDYYDGDTGMLIPRQDWMKEFASGDKWKKYTEIRERVQETNKRFNQSHGVHMYKRMYGCVWDDETEVSHGFEEYSYDGQHFISLDLKEDRYTALVPQAEPTVLKWNNDREQLDFLKQYYKHECIGWLKEFLHFSKTDIVTELSGQNLTEPIANDTKSSGSASDDLNIKFAVIIIIILVIIMLILLYLLHRKHWNELRHYCKHFMYYKEVDTGRSSTASTAPTNN